jgi:hypothetical protein
MLDIISSDHANAGVARKGHRALHRAGSPEPHNITFKKSLQAAERRRADVPRTRRRWIGRKACLNSRSGLYRRGPVPINRGCGGARASLLIVDINCQPDPN